MPVGGMCEKLHLPVNGGGMPHLFGFGDGVGKEPQRMHARHLFADGLFLHVVR